MSLKRCLVALLVIGFVSSEAAFSSRWEKDMDRVNKAIIEPLWANSGIMSGRKGGFTIVCKG